MSFTRHAFSTAFNLGKLLIQKRKVICAGLRERFLGTLQQINGFRRQVVRRQHTVKAVSQLVACNRCRAFIAATEFEFSTGNTAQITLFFFLGGERNVFACQLLLHLSHGSGPSRCCLLCTEQAKLVRDTRRRCLHPLQSGKLTAQCLFTLCFLDVALCLCALLFQRGLLFCFNASNAFLACRRTSRCQSFALFLCRCKR